MTMVIAKASAAPSEQPEGALAARQRPSNGSAMHSLG
jgi:hypothetical protein